MNFSKGDTLKDYCTGEKGFLIEENVMTTQLKLYFPKKLKL